MKKGCRNGAGDILLTQKCQESGLLRLELEYLNQNQCQKFRFDYSL